MSSFFTAETIAPICESIMLICFGLSWPINAMKAYRARTAKATSLFFIILIMVGYVGGIMAKILNGGYTGPKAYVFYLYILNFVIVSINLVIYFRNRGLDKKNEQ